MRAGRLRDIITFGELVETQDQLGGVTVAFSSKCQAYGRCIPSASVTHEGEGDRNILVYRFESRYVDGVYPDMAIKINDETDVWTITEVIDPSGKKERLEFTAQKEFKHV